MRRLNRMPAALALAFMLGQTLPAEAPDAANLERIRRGLAESPGVEVSAPLPREGVVFRMTVHGRKPDQPIWADKSGVPPYIRSVFPSYHFEFLQQVTNEDFRSGTLYPGALGLPIVTLTELMVKGVKTVHRKNQESRAREEVKKAMEAFLACRANPARPGC
jgi:hypothetical protein